MVEAPPLVCAISGSIISHIPSDQALPFRACRDWLAYPLWTGTAPALIDFAYICNENNGYSPLWGHPFMEKGGNLVEWDFVGIVIEIAVICTGNYQQLLVAAIQFLKRIFTHISGMSIFAMHNHDGIAYFPGPVKQWEVYKRER